MRTNAEMDADLAKMEEAAHWIPLTGHTLEQEIEMFEMASRRLIQDLNCEVQARLFVDDRDGLVSYLKMLRNNC